MARQPCPRFPIRPAYHPAPANVPACAALNCVLQAYPYYASCASMMAGFLAVGAFFLYTKA